MNKFNFAIIDDDKNTRELIYEKLNNILKSASFELFSSAIEYLNAIRVKNYDLIFLDIEMPGINGIECAKYINQNKIDTKVVFVSNREDLVFESLQTVPFGFVRKKEFDKDIDKIITRFLEVEKKEAENNILIQTNGTKITLKLKDIAYIESSKKSQIVHLYNANEYITYSTYTEFLQKLESKGFIECCKGILINYKYIKAIEKDNIILKINISLPMSRRKANEVKNKYLELMQDRLMIIY